ncbi:MAG TPA: glycoside hydrolase family 15 protein [Chthoniobacteraceae bacterium]|nr:glycoside hydrolase family 15 protein [Chthoniobacteraceae bacterium]
MSYQPIENHGVIGDLRTAALVGMDGTIDFMCFPRFDSPTVFASLLDDRHGGRFQLAPQFDHQSRKQMYLPDSCILLTRFFSDEGMAEVSDFMPVPAAANVPTRLVRRAKTVRGEVRFKMTCKPHFNYARAEHRIERRSGHEVAFISSGRDRTALRLVSETPVKLHAGAAVAEFTLRAGASALFVLEEAQPRTETACDSREFLTQLFKETLNFWQRWMDRCTYSGRWREVVNRSALTLKLCISREFGSLVAAPTFGLPEIPGGPKNWDYRYTWIRDACFTINSLMALGYREEATAFMAWMEDRCREIADTGNLQVMYGIDGRRDLRESSLRNMEGYRGSSPVRIGNAAFEQSQIDICGELVNTALLYDSEIGPISNEMWDHLSRIITWATKNWRKKGSGIWEYREYHRRFLYSELMCWQALDSGIRLGHRRSLPYPVLKWISARNTIYKHILKAFWNPREKAFVQSPGSRLLDSANLQMPLTGFIGPTDSRWVSTHKVMQERLMSDTLVYRYEKHGKRSAAHSPEEGTFCICSFWNIECLARAGNVEQARLLFEKMLGYANHLGLYAEELGPCGEHLGNFPQAYTHLGLIGTAMELDRRLDHRDRQ